MGRLTDRRSRGLALAGGAIYALFLTIAPFEHHDLVCHLKTPQHCTSCSSGVVGSQPGAPVASAACSLADAGRAAGDLVLAEDILLPVHWTGRSPPDH